MATLAISRPRRIIKWKYLPRYSGRLRNCDLGRFHHQEAQHRTPLFGEMSQSSPIPARVLQRYQSQIARDLLATLKPILSPDD